VGLVKRLVVMGCSPACRRLVFSKVLSHVDFVTVVVTFGRRWYCKVGVVAEEVRQQGRGAARVSTRATHWLAWSLAGLSVAMFVAGVALWVLARSAQLPSALSASVTFIDMLTAVPVLAFPVVGALIASRRPRNPIGWICLAEGLLWAFLGMIESYGLYGLAQPNSVPFPVGVYALGEWLWVPTVGLLGIYLVLLFPDGRLPSRRWRPLAWLSGAVIVLGGAGNGLAPGPIVDFGGVRNPYGLEAQPWVAGAANAILVVFLLCILASVSSLVLRYRHSLGEERQQIKWIAFAASVSGVGFVSVMAGALIVLAFAPGSIDSANTPPVWFDLLFSVVLLSFGGVPIAVGFAVLRYRLYDIDVIINRALVYVSLTATLALIYLGSVVGLQAVFRTLTGQESTFAIVVSTLAIAALFTPLRRRIQSFIDRRFYRKKYDARKTLEAFSARLRDETDLERLSEHLVGVVGEAMHPAHASLWLRSETDRRVRGEASSHATNAAPQK
jgi:hypothetical protein